MPYKNAEQQKTAQRKYYERNREIVIARGAALRAKKRAIIHKAKNVPCADCKIQYPYYVMQFDHLRDKTFTLSNLSQVKLKTLIEEIAKCEVVCANCHAERSHQRRV